MKSFLAALLLMPFLAFGAAPCNRLTLQSHTPVMTADTVSGMIYYTPYKGCDTTPIAGVDTHVGELSIALDASAHPNGWEFDLFVFKDASGVVRLGTSTEYVTNRIDAIASSLGVYVNATSISLWYNGGAVAVAAGNATYVGTFWATANAQTKMILHPEPCAGGCGNSLALWNAYNREPVVSRTMDLTTSWTYCSTAIRQANGYSNNYIKWVDGLGQSPVTIRYFSTVTNLGVAMQAATVAVGIDAYSGSHAMTITQTAWSTGNTGGPVDSFDTIAPLLGIHTAVALEQATSACVEFLGNGFSSLTISLGM